MKFLSIIFNIFFVAGLYAQEAPLFYDKWHPNGRIQFPKELNNQTAIYLIAEHPALQFWLSQAEALKKNKKLKRVKFNGNKFLLNSSGQRLLMMKNDNIALCNLSEGFQKIGPTLHGNDASFNKRGTRFAICDDNKLFMYDSENGTLIKELDGHTDVINSITFNHDDSLLGSSSKDQTVRIWNLKNKELLHSLMHEKPVNNILFNFDSSLIATFSGSKIFIWDSKTGKCLQSHEYSSDLMISDAEFHPSSNIILMHLINNSDDLVDICTFVWDLNSNIHHKWYNIAESGFLADGSIIGLMPYAKNEQNQNSAWEPVKIKIHKTGYSTQSINCLLVEDDISLRISPDKKIFWVRDAHYHVYDFLLHKISNNNYPFKPAQLILNGDNSKMIWFDLDNHLFIGDLYNKQLKADLLKNLTLDQAQILIDLYNNFERKDYVMPSSIRNIDAFNNFPGAIKYALVKTGKLPQPLLKQLIEQEIK